MTDEAVEALADDPLEYYMPVTGELPIEKWWREQANTLQRIALGWELRKKEGE